MKRTKKGFTLVELVIVIAVIAILASVLIPVFSGMIKKARLANDTQLVKNINKLLAIANVSEEKNATMHEALIDVEAGGYIVERIEATAGKDYELVWDSISDRFALWSDKENDFIYKDELTTGLFEEISDGRMHELHDFFKVVNIGKVEYNKDDEDLFDGFSLYLYYDFVNDDKAKNEECYKTWENSVEDGQETDGIVLNVGIDTGDVAGINVITYDNRGASKAKTVLLRTSGATNLNVYGYIAQDGSGDEVHHYGDSGEQKISVALRSYHEHGGATIVEVLRGHYVQEANSIVAYIIASAVDGDVWLSFLNGSIQGTVTNTNEVHKVVIENEEGAFTIYLQVNETNGPLEVRFKSQPKYANTFDKHKENINNNMILIEGVGNGRMGRENMTPPSTYHICYDKDAKKIIHLYAEIEGLNIKVCKRCGGFEYIFNGMKEGQEKIERRVINFGDYEGQSGDNSASSKGKRVFEEGEIIDEHVHAFGEWKEVKEATCVQQGILTRTCKTCGGVETKYTKALGHNFVDGTCSRCQKKESDVKECNHKYNLVSEYSKAATCLNAGFNYYICELCDESKIEDVNALKHNFVVDNTREKAATCEADGLHAWICDRTGCGAKTEEVIAHGGHQMDSGTYRSATCTNDGGTTYKCKNEGCTYEEFVLSEGKLYHDFSGDYVDEKNGKHYRVCSRANCNEHSTSVEHTWDDGSVTKPHTCDQDGEITKTCIYCGASKIEVDSAHHTIGETKKFEAATCTKDGTAWYECSVCKKQINNEKIDKLGHQLGNWESISETQHQRKCNRENCTYKETEDHNYSSNVCLTCNHRKSVVFIGEKGYSNLQLAINAAKDGDVIRVGQDYVDQSFSIPSTLNVTIDLDGHTLTLADNQRGSIAGNLTIKDSKGTGKLTGTGDGDGLLNVNGSGSLKLLSGQIASTGANPVVKTKDNAKLDVQSGYVKGTITKVSPSNVNITGGYFSVDPTEFLDTALYQAIYQNGWFVIKPVSEGYYVRVDPERTLTVKSTYYNSIQDALAYVYSNNLNNPDIVVLRSMSTYGVELKSKVNINLGNNTLTNNSSSGEALFVVYHDGKINGMGCNIINGTIVDNNNPIVKIVVKHNGSTASKKEKNFLKKITKGNGKWKAECTIESTDSVTNILDMEMNNTLGTDGLTEDDIIQTIESGIFEDDPQRFVPGYTKDQTYGKNDKGGSITIGSFTVTKIKLSGQNYYYTVSKESISTTINTVSLEQNVRIETVGSSHELIREISVSPENGIADIEWMSSNSEVATVDSNGVVKANSKGEATITLTVYTVDCKEKSVTSLIKVGPVPVINSIELRKEGYDVINQTVTLNKDASVTITPVVDANVTCVGTWTSNDTSIATVDNGKVTMKKPGSTIITYKASNEAEGVSKEVSFTVSCPIEISSVSIKDGSNAVSSLTITEDKELTGVVVANSDQVTKEWSSDNKNVVTVDQNGKVTVVGQGEANITFKVYATNVEAKTATVKITVTKKEESKITSVTISQQGNKLSAKVVVVANCEYTVSWKLSEGQSIQSITADKNGDIAINKISGGATITCTVTTTDGKETKTATWTKPNK